MARLHAGGSEETRKEHYEEVCPTPSINQQQIHSFLPSFTLRVQVVNAYYDLATGVLPENHHNLPC